MTIESSGRGPRTSTPLWYTKDAYLIAEFQRVGRFLFGESPQDAEFLAEISPVLRQVSNKQSFVVQFENARDPGEKPTFMIVRDGTRYVTQTVPANAHEAIIVTRQPGQSQGVVLKRLQRIAKAIQRVSKPAYLAWKIESKLEKIERWCGDFNPDLLNAESVLQDLLSQEIVEEASSQKKAMKSVLANGTENITRVEREFAFLGMPGVIAQKLMATLTFFALHPEPHRVTQTIEQIVGGLGSALAELTPGGVLAIPPMTLGFYLTHPNLGGRASFIAARGAARFLRREAKERCISALSANRIVDFHFDLYLALSAYRGAQEIYSEIKFIGDHVPEIWSDFSLSRDEIQKAWIETEEARVTILAALSHGAMRGQHGWNPARPPLFLAQVAAMVSSGDIAAAEVAIHDLAVRLICPRFVRDLSVAFLHLVDGGSADRWSDRVMRIIGQLEIDFERSVMLGEPNYLFYAYTIGALMHRRGERDGEAQILESKRNQLPHRVRSFVRGESPPSA